MQRGQLRRVNQLSTIKHVHPFEIYRHLAHHPLRFLLLVSLFSPLNRFIFWCRDTGRPCPLRGVINRRIVSLVRWRAKFSVTFSWRDTYRREESRRRAGNCARSHIVRSLAARDTVVKRCDQILDLFLSCRE